MDDGGTYAAPTVCSARNFQIAQLFKPQIHVLRHDGRALQRGGRKPDDHETHSRAQQRRQQADFIFCKWQCGGHGSNFFAVVPTAVVPAKSGYGGHCRNRLVDLPPKQIAFAPSAGASSVERMRRLVGLICAVSCLRPQFKQFRRICHRHLLSASPLLKIRRAGADRCSYRGAGWRCVKTAFYSWL